MAATSSSPPCSSSLSLSLSAKKVGQQRFPALRRFLFFFFLSFQPTPGLCRATSVRGKSVCVCTVYITHTQRHTHGIKSHNSLYVFFLFFFCAKTWTAIDFRRATRTWNPDRDTPGDSAACCCSSGPGFSKLNCTKTNRRIFIPLNFPP